MAELSQLGRSAMPSYRPGLSAIPIVDAGLVNLIDHESVIRLLMFRCVINESSLMVAARFAPLKTCDLTVGGFSKQTVSTRCDYLSLAGFCVSGRTGSMNVAMRSSCSSCARAFDRFGRCWAYQSHLWCA